MKQRTRSAVALVTTSLLTGGGIAAAVTGFGQQPPVAGTTAGQAGLASSDPALSAAVHDLLTRSKALHGRLTTTRHELVVLDRRLDHQRRLARHLATAPVPSPATRGAGAPAGAPQVHAATGASGASGAGSASPPGVHATTRASGAGSATAPQTHTTTRASGAGSANAPNTHTTTRASGAGGEHEGRDD